MPSEKHQQKKPKKPSRPRVQAVQFSVWSVSGGPLPEAAMKIIEAKFQEGVIDAFNNGYRVLTQTNRS